MGTTYRTRAYRERASKALMDLRAQERQIEETAGKAFAAFTVGTERASAARAQAQAQKKVLASYQAEYKAGKRSLLDLLDAQNATFTSQFQLASAEAVNVFGAYQLLGAMNRLLAAMGITETPDLGPTLLQQSKQNIFSINIEPLR
jgi:adhesin transport system outer membrane protein